LLTRRGIGPDNTAALLIAAGNNPDRRRSEASFAARCGVSPLGASSRKTSRRRLNAAATAKPIPRSTASPYRGCAGKARTRDYLARRSIEGKTRRKAIRCLKHPRDLPDHHVLTRSRAVSGLT
jgi:transposase